MHTQSKASLTGSSQPQHSQWLRSACKACLALCVYTSAPERGQARGQQAEHVRAGSRSGWRGVRIGRQEFVSAQPAVRAALTTDMRIITPPLSTVNFMHHGHCLPLSSHSRTSPWQWTQSAQPPLHKRAHSDDVLQVQSCADLPHAASSARASSAVLCSSAGQAGSLCAHGAGQSGCKLPVCGVGVRKNATFFSILLSEHV